MKKYSLSSPVVRITGATISGIFIVIMGTLVFLFRTDLLSFMIMALCAILVSAVLVFYTVNIYKAACVPSADRNLTVIGFPDL